MAKVELLPLISNSYITVSVNARERNIAYLVNYDQVLFDLFHQSFPCLLTLLHYFICPGFLLLCLLAAALAREYRRDALAALCLWQGRLGLFEFRP